MQFLQSSRYKITFLFLLTGVLAFGFHFAHASVYVSSTQGLWHFSAASSTQDSSGNNWALDGSAVPNTTSSFVSTNLHESFDDTSHQYVLTSTSTNFYNNFTSFSIFSWVKTSNNASRIFSDASQDSVVLYLSGGNLWCQLYIDGIGAKSAHGSTAVNDNAKHHVGCVWDGSASGTLYTYVDGNQDASTTNTGTGHLRNGSSALYVGDGTGNTEQFTGQMDEMVLTNTALSASKISSLYNSGNGNEVCTTVNCDSTSTVITISNLEQYHSDGTTSISEGATVTDSSTVKLSADAQTTGTSTVKLQIELQPYNQQFTGTANLTSTTSVTSGTITIATSSLPDGLYRWRARAVDGNGFTSNGWATISTPAVPYDFAIDANQTVTVALPSSSVYALYHFDPKRPAYDDSPSNFTLDGSATPNTTSSFMANGRYAFDDTSHQYVYTSTSTNFYNNFTSFSVFAWINMTGTSTRIFSDASQDSIVLYKNGSNQLACQVYVDGHGAYSATSNTTLNTNQMYYVGCVWNGSTVQVYINGAADGAAASTASGNLRNGTSALYISEGASNSEQFVGEIDEVLLTNTALSTSTISQLYNSGQGAQVCIASGCGYPAPTITTSTQYQANGTASIPPGGTNSDATTTFSVGFTSATGTTAQLQVEVLQAGTGFQGTPTVSGSYVSPSASATVTFHTSLNRAYHWQARLLDSNGVYSAWQLFGSSPDSVDFRVSSLANAASMYFDGSSSLTYSASNIAFAATDSSTIEFWYRTPVTSTVPVFVDTRQTDGSNYKGNLISRDWTSGVHFFLGCASGTIDFYAGSSSLRQTGNPTYDANGGDWQNIAITKSSGTTSSAFTFYFDGVSSTPNWVSQGPISGNCFVSSATDTIYFGNSAISTSTSNALTGNLDEVQIWNIERSSGDISSGWSEQVLAPNVGLVRLWRFNGSPADFEGNVTSSQAGSPSFASSTPFDHYYRNPSLVAVNTSTRSLVWASSTLYLSQWNSAVATWKGENTITISSTSIPSSADLIITDASSSNVGVYGEYCSENEGCDFSPATSQNYIFLNLPHMATLSTSGMQHVPIHELGHALGLGHSWWGEIMYLTSSTQTYLGNQDKVDYHFLWGF